MRAILSIPENVHFPSRNPEDTATKYAAKETLPTLPNVPPYDQQARVRPGRVLLLRGDDRSVLQEAENRGNIPLQEKFHNGDI